MKLHCNRCQKDFTTLSERDKSKKFAFSHLILNKMKCPHCGASNQHLLTKVKKGKSRSSRSRGYAGWDSDSNRPEPNIIVHPDCRARLIGNIGSPNGLEVHCEGCKCIFNCWTGNVDDGDYVSPLTKSIDVQREEAIVKVQEKKRDDDLQWLQDSRKRMGKIGFGYEFRKQVWYARFGGTVWKLTNDDVQAIRNSTWDTPQTMIIKRTFYNKGVKLILAKSLLMWEMLIHNRGA